MLRLNTIVTNRGFKPATFVNGKRMWVKGTRAVIRHERNSQLYKLHGKQILELIDEDNVSTYYSYDNSTLMSILLDFTEERSRYANSKKEK